MIGGFDYDESCVLCVFGFLLYLASWFSVCCLVILLFLCFGGFRVLLCKVWFGVIWCF